jgi:hypothetical protein
MEEKPTRRNVLKKLGAAGIVGTIGLSTTATAKKQTNLKSQESPITAPGATSADNNDKLPIQAQGKTIRKYRPKDDAFEVKEQFISQALKQRYGTNVVKFEPELVPLSAIPEKYKDPNRPFNVQYQEEAVIGTNEQHAHAESQIKSTSDGITVQAVTYDGPIYVYKSGTAAENDTASKRSGPINLDWTSSINKNASQVKQYMKNRGWTACCAFYSGTRYILDNGDPKGQDTHIYQEIDYTKQYHIRVYNVNVSDSLGTEVVGQIHKDPYDHNQIGNKPWYFNESRDEVKSDWESWGYNTQYHCTCATQWGTHDGNLAAISD